MVDVLVKVLQRNKISMYMYKEIYFKEMTHMSMEADKSQDLS